MSDKIKTLSQAIRLGATFRPQGLRLFLYDGKTCAIGAAAEAVFGDKINYHMAECVEGLRQRFMPDGIFHEIYHRNDRGDTREEIAEWLEAQGL